jgi:hypothetical protein
MYHLRQICINPEMPRFNLLRIFRSYKCPSDLKTQLDNCDPVTGIITYLLKSAGMKGIVRFRGYLQFYAISVRHFGISAPQPDFSGFDYFDLLGGPHFRKWLKL